MRLSIVILGVLLLAFSDAWGIRFYGKSPKGKRVHFLLKGDDDGKSECRPVPDEYKDIVVDHFRWNPTTDGRWDVDRFESYPNDDCMNVKGQGTIRWKGEKTKTIKVHKRQTVRSYQVHRGNEAKMVTANVGSFLNDLVT
jgi:hypothetical protein